MARKNQVKCRQLSMFKTQGELFWSKEQFRFDDGPSSSLVEPSFPDVDASMLPDAADGGAAAEGCTKDCVRIMSPPSLWRL